MHSKAELLECVPNISEGRDSTLIDTIARAGDSVPGARVLHIDSNADANRTVFTLVGTPPALQEAMFELALVAIERIDMRQHAGVHRRLGAVDVVPFVPLGELPMSVAIDHAKSFGNRLFSELSVPVYWYEACAKDKKRTPLPYVRGKGYAALAERFATSTLLPDLHSGAVNEKSGASVVGARPIMIAYNINLGTRDVEIAKRIAERMRSSGWKETRGGKTISHPGRLPHLRAIGWMIEEYGCAQVSMNLLNFKETGLFEVFEVCKELAVEFGTSVEGSELIGMLPAQALQDVAVKLRLSEDQEQLGKVVSYLGLDSLREFRQAERVLEYSIGSEQHIVPR